MAHSSAAAPKNGSHSHAKPRCPRPSTSLKYFQGTGSKPANMSFASANVLSGTHSHSAKNLSHIASTLGFLCAASIASRDFHSETSIIVPVAREHDCRDPIGHKSFFVQSRNTRSHELEKFLLFAWFGPVSYHRDHAAHKKIDIYKWTIQGDSILCCTPGP